MAGIILPDTMLESSTNDKATVGKSERKEKEKGFIWKYRK
jgi:hypothetical protein